ncbi:hypothetical protein ABIE65_004902 [Constrictibacter sp. MBR-5]|jgi:hypothetical protein|uniref:hypothetical protein n=1 Tax=Constrictibacter sp. MBR-5 TaxID=3156467 RepID=UPI0033981B19
MSDFFGMIVMADSDADTIPVKGFVSRSFRGWGMRRSVAVVAGAVLLAGCQSTQPGPSRDQVAKQDVELLGGFYRRVGSHWISVGKGALLTADQHGGYCASPAAEKVAISGSLVCLYPRDGTSTFDRAVLFSNFGALQQFSFKDGLPYRSIAPATWPNAAPQV